MGKWSEIISTGLTSVPFFSFGWRTFFFCKEYLRYFILYKFSLLFVSISRVHYYLLNFKKSVICEEWGVEYLKQWNNLVGLNEGRWLHKLRKNLYIKNLIYFTLLVHRQESKMNSFLYSWRYISSAKYIEFYIKFYLSLRNHLWYPPSLFQHVSPSVITIISTINL
jgi:hypothetical protein